MKTFVIDIARCNGCYCCQIACKDEHVGNDWTPYAKPQPDTGQYWMKMNEFVRGTVPKVKMHYQPLLCAHCDKALCREACPIEDAIYKRDDGLVIIDPTKCSGCKNCVDACPYHAIYFNEDLNIAQKCTGCAHLLDNGWKVPRCVDACPTECLKFGEDFELRDLIMKGESPHPEFKIKPRLYYLNMPKRFVAGTVYDPAANEVVVGAICTLSDVGSGDRFTATTDGFGDFWFDGLKVGDFSLKIAKDGKSRTLGPINTKKDANLGEIPLS
jgi:Fe-S-cluster-containing dehydrogenase component